jgi:Domain of unknown function (DUF397)
MISMNRPATRAAAPSRWFKASVSSNAASCVETRFDGALVHIRDSKYRRNPANDPAREPIITITCDQWQRFLDEMTGRAGVAANGALTVVTTADGITTKLRATKTGLVLTFTAAEWNAFLSGVRAHEFDHPESVVTT